MKKSILFVTSIFISCNLYAASVGLIIKNIKPSIKVFREPRPKFY